MMLVDTGKMLDIKKLASSKFEHLDELITLSKEAESFLKSHKWCKRIVGGWLDRGWGYIIAVFYFALEPAYNHVPDNIWVIVGDLPPAYIDAQDNPNGACAIDAYVIEMQKWIDNVMSDQPVKGLIPVNAPPTKEYAQMLQSRMDIIRNEVLTKLNDEIRDGLNIIP